MNQSIQTIANALKTARRARQITQTELSAKTGMPQSHISKIERGMVDLSLSSLIEISRVLGLEVTLTPPKTAHALQSISGEQDVETSTAFKRAIKKMEETHRLAVSQFAGTPNSAELKKLQERLKELSMMPGNSEAVRAIENLNKQLKQQAKNLTSPIDSSLMLSGLNDIRTQLVHQPSPINKQTPAYQLTNDD